MATVAAQQSGEVLKTPQRTMSTKPSSVDYELDIRQQPRQARMCGSGEKADRRPLDPPPILRLRIKKASSSKKRQGTALTEADYTSPTLTHTLFCFASLVGEHDDQELYLLSGSRSQHVTGSVVSSLFHLKDQSCFVFPDLSVRTEGRWRFKMSMYEIVEDGVHFRKSVFTDPFQVYSSKRFPGMGQSTALSKEFAQQGLRLRVRRPGPSLKHDEDSQQEERAVPRQRNISAGQAAPVRFSGPPPSLPHSASHPSLASRKRSQHDLAAARLGDQHSAWGDRPSFPSTSSHVPPQRRIASLPRHHAEAPPGSGDGPQLPMPYGRDPRLGHSHSHTYAYPSHPFHAEHGPSPSGYRPPRPDPYYHAPDAYGPPPAHPHHHHAPPPPPLHETPTVLAPIRSARAREASDTSASQPSSSGRSNASTSTTSHPYDSSSRPATAGAGVAPPPFLPAPSRSPEWDRERQRYQAQQQQQQRGADGMVRQLESSERRGSGPDEEEGQVEGEDEVREREEKRRKSSGGASLAKLLGEGARDAKAVDSHEPFFFAA